MIHVTIPTKPTRNPDVSDADIRRSDMVEAIVDHMCLKGKSTDPAYLDDFWIEIENILCIPNQRERMDAIEDMTLMDIMKRAAERRVKAFNG